MFLDYGRQRWRLHRVKIDRLRRLSAFGRDKQLRRVLFVSVRDPISHAQLFPFFFYRAELRDKYGLDVREIPLAHLVEDRPHPFQGVDTVCVQTWFDLSNDQLHRVMDRIGRVFPGARLAYLDWFAPTDLRYADALHDRIDCYYKKHVLRDRTQYGQVTLGDTNLTDFYARRYGLPYRPTQFPIPDGFMDKLVLATNFILSPQIRGTLGNAPRVTDRPIDLHSRLSVHGTEWYQRMRQEALECTSRLAGAYQVVSGGKVSPARYFAELQRSKACFSPFGYGEVCWRDFEAMGTGSLLMKPDMSHLDCQPQLYKPFETYVPLRWDLSDLPEKLDHYLRCQQERQAIVTRAYAQVREYVETCQFLEDLKPFLTRLGLVG